MRWTDCMFACNQIEGGRGLFGHNILRFTRWRKPLNLFSAGADVENNVTVAYTSDKGLWGGINSTVTKYTRGVVRATEGGEAHAVLYIVLCSDALSFTLHI